MDEAERHTAVTTEVVLEEEPDHERRQTEGKKIGSPGSGRVLGGESEQFRRRRFRDALGPSARLILDLRATQAMRVG